MRFSNISKGGGLLPTGDCTMEKPKLLIVDDDKNVREVVKSTLKSDNLTCYEASTRRRFLEIIKNYPLDIILLDLTLSDGSALDLIPELRQHTNASILILSGSTNDDHRIICLENGADDYIAKPFRPVELRARVHANIRRLADSSRNAANNNHLSGYSAIRFGSWTLCPASCRVHDQDKQDVKLTAYEFALLEKLVAEPRRVHSRYDLLHATRQERSLPCHERAIDIQITRLRKKLNDHDARTPLIRTIRGMGYMLDCETEKLP